MMSSINESSEIPISETLESLLTNIEFVIEDSTMTNLTAEDSTTDVTENNPTATSTFTTEYSTIDVEKDNDESLPEHFFVPNTIIGKTGKMKGVTRTAWTLIIGPHTFKKHRNKNNISYFSCNDCLRDKKTITFMT